MDRISEMCCCCRLLFSISSRFLSSYEDGYPQAHEMKQSAECSSLLWRDTGMKYLTANRENLQPGSCFCGKTDSWGCISERWLCWCALVEGWGGWNRSLEDFMTAVNPGQARLPRPRALLVVNQSVIIQEQSTHRKSPPASLISSQVMKHECSEWNCEVL